MTLQRKAGSFYATCMVGAVILMFLVALFPGHPLLVLPFLVWFGAFGLLQFVLLRCPYCRSLAIRTKRGAYVPWVGTECRYCGKPY
jgi:hypothetical protein